MKIALLFLLLVNLLFYGWSQWVATPPGGSLRATPEIDAKRLTLHREAYPGTDVAELDVTTLEVPQALPPETTEAPPEVPVVLASTPAPEPAASEPEAEPDEEPAPAPPPAPPPEPETASAAVAGTPNRCVQLGPFLRLRETTEAAARLREFALEPSQRLEESEIWVGHWVYLPAFPTRAAAVAEVERLREGGITDNYIEPSGELRNSVSLGLFSDRARAETRADEARDLGASPEIRDRYRTGTVYWLEFDMAPEQPLDISEFTTQPNRPVELKDRACDAAG